MGSILIPIAISSQLDISGEERIHAAGYRDSSRLPYVPVIPPTMFLATSLGGFIFTSPDGITWTQQSSPTTNNLLFSGGGEGYGFATGSSPATFLSSPTPGNIWTPCIFSPSTPTLGCVPCAGLGAYWLARNQAISYKSLDGNNFVLIPVLTGTTSASSAYGDEDIVLFGIGRQIYRTVDGTTFTTANAFPSTSVTVSDIIRTPNFYVASGSFSISNANNVARSPTAQIWASTHNSNFSIRGLAWGTGTVYPGVTSSGVGLMGGDGGLLKRSLDEFGVDFTSIVTPSSFFLNGVASDGKNTFVLAYEDTGNNNGYIAVSTDATQTWQIISSPFAGHRLRNVSYISA